jgi:drug/metabolite transporter (DMT)-like permease
MISAADRAAYGPLTLNFARRELTSRYKRSLLGWTWSVLNPLATVATYTLIFGVVFRAAPPETANGRGEYFSLYVFTGLVVWTIFTGVVNGSMGWMSGVSDMRKKVYFPAETAIFGGTIAIAAQSLVEVAVLAVIMILLLNISPVFVLFPVVTMGLGAWLANEPVTAQAAAGAALVMGGVWFGALSPGGQVQLLADKFIKRERLFVVHDNVFFNQKGDVICSGRGWTIRPM